MTKSDLIKTMASDTGLLKVECQKVINSFTKTITQSLKDGNGVKLIGFGNFTVNNRAARKGSHPRTGAEIQIAASKVARFKAGKEFKAALNG